MNNYKVETIPVMKSDTQRDVVKAKILSSIKKNSTKGFHLASKVFIPSSSKNSLKDGDLLITFVRYQ